jgi:hypothetical protein
VTSTRFGEKGKQADDQNVRLCCCLCRVGLILGVVQRPGRGRMRDRFSPRSIWRLPAERGCCRRCAPGRSSSCSGRSCRSRGASYRLRGGLPLAPGLPALRRSLIAWRELAPRGSRKGLPGWRPLFLMSRRRLVDLRWPQARFWGSAVAPKVFLCTALGEVVFETPETAFPAGQGGGR